MSDLHDRVQETTTTTGTGNITLAGAVTGYETFQINFALNENVFYCIDDGAGNWEIGTGHLSATTTLVRDVVLSSSNSDTLVSFGAGTKNVFNTLPAVAMKASSYGRSLALARGMAMT